MQLLTYLATATRLFSNPETQRAVVSNPWDDQTTTTRVLIVAVPTFALLAVVSGSCLLGVLLGRCSRRPPRAAHTGGYIPLTERVEAGDAFLYLEVKADLLADREIAAQTSLVDSKCSVFSNPWTGRAYKQLRRTELAILKHELLTSPDNLNQTNRCMGILFVIASDSIEMIATLDSKKVELLDKNAHYTGIALFEFFYLYWQAYTGRRRVQDGENVKLIHDDLFDRGNFTKPGTVEHNWLKWHDEIARRLRSSFTEDELRTAAFYRYIQETASAL